MKTIYYISLLLAVATRTELVHGQSSFQFRNYRPSIGLDAPVFDSAGNRLAGTNYLVILYGGPTVDSLAPAWRGSFVMAPAPFTFMPGGQSGYFSESFVYIPSVSCGGVAWLQVRAWDAHLGTSYEEAVSQDLGGYGESNLFQKQGGYYCGLPGLPEPLTGLQSFALRDVIPEPSSTLLLLLGLPALFFLRRRRFP